VLALGAIAGPTTATAQISDSNQAAQAQYPDISPPATTREEKADDNSLPFTGYAAFPLLIAGALLLVAGGVMHVRTRSE
jgi:hypothetical protein